ncbi:MAG: DUF86 domain-containing protein [Spirochaetota bacterium]|nr:DUF86 domain-containing protein [Spirochaetota bacterium]
MKRIIADYVEDILIAISNAIKFIENITIDEFKKDDKTIYAVEKALEIIGEASKKIPNEIKKRYPELPWRKLSKIRNKFTHEYFGLDLDIVWKIINDELPSIKPSFAQLLNELDQEKSNDHS